jgi:choline dehydrogenase-like flavoprotein
MAIPPSGDQAEAANGSNGSHESAVCSLETFLQQQFTYIICGGGTAGLAIAARLTEDPNVTVGVLEAGADRRGDFMIDVPALFLRMFGQKEYDWRYKTVPQVSSPASRVLQICLTVY